MNLSIFFEPLPEHYKDAEDQQSLGFYTDAFIHAFPDFRSADIAFIGLHEFRGSDTRPEQSAPNAVREVLYKLRKGTGNQKIADLGNLMPGITLEDTYLRLQEIVEVLISENTIPVLIGGSHDLTYGQFLAYENLNPAVNMANIDSRVDIAEAELTPANRHHLHQIFMHKPNYLFSFSQIGHQRYLVEQEVLNTLEKLHFETYRVGDVHGHLPQIEPAIRHADLISIDVSAIRFQDAPAYAPANPFGLTGEEICQLCWYAGQNDQLTSLGIYEYNPDLDPNRLAAMTLSTMIWYFIEGYYHRKNEVDFTSQKFTKYAVGFHDNPNKMVFYKSNKSDKWWMEVESISGDHQVKIVPCTYDDYVTASNGEVPNRWIVTQARMA